MARDGRMKPTGLPDPDWLNMIVDEQEKVRDIHNG